MLLLLFEYSVMKIRLHQMLLLLLLRPLLLQGTSPNVFLAATPEPRSKRLQQRAAKLQQQLNPKFQQQGTKPCHITWKDLLHQVGAGFGV